MSDKRKGRFGAKMRAGTERVIAGLTTPAEEIVINATMLGASGVGKTSLLAAMYDRFLHVVGQADLDILPDSDTTRELNQSLIKLKELPTAVRVTAAVPGTADVRLYRLGIGPKGRRPAFTLRFTDYPGKYLVRDDYSDRAVVEEALLQSDVILVAIDTPALVEQAGRFHDMVNVPMIVIDEIRRLLAESAESRLLILTLLKCETYVTTPADVEKLVKLVKTSYQPLLDHIRGEGVRDRVGCVLAAVQTVGAVRLLKVDDESPTNPVFHFCATSIKAHYQPVDTDQPLRYLLRFVINKYRAEGRPFRKWITEWVTGVDSKLGAAVDTFAKECKTSGGFEIVQHHPLLQAPPWTRTQP